MPRIASSTPSDSSSSTTDTAAAVIGASLSICLKTKTDATCVWNGMFPEIRTIEPNSPTARANASAQPLMIAGPEVRQHDPAEGRPAARAERRGRLLHVAVELDQHRLDRAHDERQRHEQQRQRDRGAA